MLIATMVVAGAVSFPQLGIDRYPSLDMPTVSEIQHVFVQAASGTYRLLIADDHVDATTARTTVVTLANTPVAIDRWALELMLGVADTAGDLLLAGASILGQTWIVRLDGNDALRYEVTVGGGINSVAALAGAFATAINAAAGDFVASAVGGQLKVTKAGGSFTAEFGIRYTYDVQAGDERGAPV